MAISKTISFSVFTVAAGEDLITGKQISSIKDGDLKKEVIGDEVVYLGVFKKVKLSESRFVGLCFSEGDKYPFIEIVRDLHSKDLIEKNNPRKANEVEMKDTLLVLFDLHKSRMFVSNLKKLDDLKTWINNSGIPDFTFRPLLNEKEFIDKINDVSSIGIVFEPELHNHDSSVINRELSKEVYGHGANEALLELRYKNSLSTKAKNAVKSFMKNKSDFKQLTIQGRTSEKFLAFYNGEEVIVKIAVRVNVDSKNRSLKADEVLENLLDRITKDIKY